MALFHLYYKYCSARVDRTIQGTPDRALWLSEFQESVKALVSFWGFNIITDINNYI